MSFRRDIQFFSILQKNINFDAVATAVFPWEQVQVYFLFDDSIERKMCTQLRNKSLYLDSLVPSAEFLNMCTG